MSPPAETARPGRGFRLLAGATALATWALVAVGGVVRVSESGLGCPDWPLCDGRLVPAGQKEPIVEYSHRAAAALVVALLVAATAWGLARHRSRRDVVVPLAGALALVPVQAILGAIVVWLELPDRLVGVHFMVGMVMLGLSTFACAAAWRGSRPVAPSFRRLAVGTAGAGLLLVSLGAGVVATDAMHACGENWPACNGGVASGGDLAVLQVTHRSVAYAVTALALALLVQGLRGRGPALVASLPAVAAAAQIGFGVGMVLSTHGSLQHDVFRILHVAGGGAVWASLVFVAATALTVPSAGRVVRPAALRIVPAESA